MAATDTIILAGGASELAAARRVARATRHPAMAGAPAVGVRFGNNA